MISPERDTIIREAKAVIAQGSRSFRFASRLFDRRTRERAWLLYTWCRACDDAADGQVLGHGAVGASDPSAELETLRLRTRQALEGTATGDLPFEALRLLLAECPLPPAFLEDHLTAFTLDAQGWRPTSEQDLLTYCYHAAGAVGRMMAVIMGQSPDNKEVMDRASDLGIAFQLANIARDLGEDQRIGRCYLPTDWLAEYGIVPGEEMDPQHRPAIGEIVARLATLASTYEASARVGARHLPVRARWAVLSAAAIYGDIARQVVRRGSEAWDRRVVIGRGRKLRHVLGALVRAARGNGSSYSRAGLWTRAA